MTKTNKTTEIKFITFVDLSGIATTIDTGNDEQEAKVYNLIKPSQPATSNQLINQKKLSEYLVDYIKYQTKPGSKDRWTNANCPIIIPLAGNKYLGSSAAIANSLI